MTSGIFSSILSTIQTFLLCSVLVQLFVIRRYLKTLKGIDRKLEEFKQEKQKTDSQQILERDLNARMARLQQTSFSLQRKPTT